jgi:alpha-tubulin suppressor-like RCC1 family protein
MTPSRAAAIAVLNVAVATAAVAPAGGAPAGVVSITAGEDHSWALLTTGTVKCWGLNSNGQVGNGTTTGFVKQPATVTGLSGVVAISAGDEHTCALLRAGTVKCWGANLGGQLGNGTTTDAPKPVNVIGVSTVTAIAAVGGHTCALLKPGNVKCWGANNSGCSATVVRRTRRSRPA